MSFSRSSASRKSSCAAITFALSSVTSVPRNTIRSRSRREEMSNERSQRPSASTTMGTSGTATSFSATIRLHVLYATRRLHMQIEREIELPVPADEAWEAITDAQRLEEWFANDVELDLREGGEGV